MSDPKKMTFPELVNYRYGDRGGWKALTEIFLGPLSYEQKIAEAQATFKLSRSQIVRWYGRFNALGESR